MKRKKRLKRGIEFLQEQIALHKEKLQEALDEGQEELARYYEKDLARLEGEEKKKKQQLGKS